jgi:hypothetical protein
MLIVRGVEAVAEFIVSTVRLVTGTVIVAGALVLGGCAYEVAYQPS